MKTDIEFGGGLGDIINQAYVLGNYQFLDKLSENNTANIYIITHNPFVEEMFKWHPKREYINLHIFDYWHPSENAKKRPEVGMPLQIKPIMKSCTDINFYESEDDRNVLSSFLNKKFIVISAAAGELHRNIPISILDDMVLKFKELNIEIVTVGKDYPRISREEIRISGTTDLINKLSIPGTLKLIEMSIGLITCHSALNLYAWHIKKPQLLLYPEDVKNRHFLVRDQWSFGKDFDNTVHCSFDEYNMAEHLPKFINIIGNN
jgi:ADP-heptose:LPS heptosyltransferase